MKLSAQFRELNPGPQIEEVPGKIEVGAKRILVKFLENLAIVYVQKALWRKEKRKGGGVGWFGG